MEYKRYKLGDICKIFGRIGFRGYTTEDLVSSPSNGAISLSPSNIVDGIMDLSKCTYISWEKYEESPEIKIAPNDIVIVKTGNSYGRTAIIRNVEHPMTLNPQFVVLKDIQINPVYLAYFLKTGEFQKQIYGIVGGSAIPTLSQENLANLIIRVPNDNIPNAIADILDSLDGKIELNKQINDNLEAMAKQLYDYWFVQFDFPNEKGKPYKSSGGAMVWNEKLKRKIPNGWIVETVGTYANCKSGYAIKSSDFKAKGIPVIKIGNIQEDYTLNMNGCQYIENNTNKLFYVYQNDVVIAMTGATIGKFAIVPFSETGYFVNQRVGKFELGNNPIKKMPYLINSLKIDYFRNQIFQLASGCAQPNISAEQINNILLLYPSTKILSEYNMKCKWMYEQIANCRYQIDVLTKLRDKLLLLLMNGQASVNYHLS